jgi:signal peptidase
MHVEAQRQAACCDLVSEAVHASGEVRLRLTGFSMLPTVWPGDIVTVKRCELADLRPGQVVLYRAKGSLVAHRVVRTSSDHLIAHGDSVPRCDPPVYATAVIGYVASILRGQRTIDPRQRWHHRAASVFLRRSNLCLRILLRLDNHRNPQHYHSAPLATPEVL